MTQSLAIELAEYGIRVLSGFVNKVVVAEAILRVCEKEDVALGSCLDVC